MPATITVTVASRLLGICRGSGYKAVHEGDLPVLKLGRRLLVPTTAVRDLLGLTDVELAARLANPAGGGR